MWGVVPTNYGNMNTKLTGRWGEALASKYLRERGYLISAIGYTTRFGEIDIVAENKKYIVFVEVKLRKNDKFGAAMEFVGREKQRKIITSAQLYLAENEADKQPRFDVIEVYAPEGTKTPSPTINHIENAFGGE